MRCWTQWSDLELPPGFQAEHSPALLQDPSFLAELSIYVPTYLGGPASLEVVPAMSSLRYLQLLSAGFEDALAVARPGLHICHAEGVHDASTAELAVGLAISARRGFPGFVRNQAHQRWQHQRHPAFTDSKIAVVGYGGIGKTIAHYLSPFEVEVSLFSRTVRPEVRGLDELEARIPDIDIVILALPLTPDTRGLMSARLLRRMKDGALLVNVSRGPIVDTSALVDELRQGRIHAALDVTDPEPLPSDHPLWALPNCLITPHVGGDTTAFEPRARAFVERQFRAIASGVQPTGMVSP